MASRFSPILTRNAALFSWKSMSLQTRVELCAQRTTHQHGKMIAFVRCRDSSNMPARDMICEDLLVPSQTFPSIVIGPHGRIEPQGSFAKAQVQVSIKEKAAYKDTTSTEEHIDIDQ